MNIDNVAIYRTPSNELIDEFSQFKIRFIVDDVEQGSFFNDIPVVSMDEFIKHHQKTVDALFVGKMWDAPNSGGYFEKLNLISCPVVATEFFLRHVDKQYRLHWESYFDRFIHQIRSDISTVSELQTKHHILWQDIEFSIANEYTAIEPQTSHILKLLFCRHWNGIIENNRFIELIRCTHHRKSSLPTSDEYFFNDIRPGSGDTVINAGGDLGHEVPGFCRCLGRNGRHFLFEPSASSAAFLKSRFQNTPGVKVVETGLYKETGVLGLWTKAGNPGVSYVGSKAPNDNFRRTADVPVTTIDQFVFENHLDRVDFLKMDIEGGEYDALKGGKSTISEYLPKLAICVYHSRGHQKVSTFDDEDIVRIPRLLKRITDRYQFFLVGTEMTPWGGTKLFGIPKK